MLDSKTRMELVKRRAAEIREKSERRKTAFLSVISTVSALAVVFLIGSAQNGLVPGAAGSILLVDGAGGYVLTAVLAFIVSAAITAALIKKNHKNEEDKK